MVVYETRKRLNSIMALFTKKDLGLLLPDDVGGDAESLRHTQIRCVESGTIGYI